MNISDIVKKTEEKEYITFPTTLETYAWYKPILILIITAILGFAISIAIFSIIKVNPTGNQIMALIFTAITLIAMIPSLYIGTRLLYKIPFSTQIAPVRKWDWSIYIKAFVITAIVYGITLITPILTFGIKIPNNLPIAVFLLCLILPLFQGFAEEYVCRGLLMQTFGSWFKIPLVAIVLQAAIFAVLHPYQIFALISVLCTGIIYGFITWYGQGLEVSSAMHALNNISAFLAIGLGLQQGAAKSSVTTLIANLALILIPIIIILVLDKKFNWFEPKS